MELLWSKVVLGAAKEDWREVFLYYKQVCESVHKADW